VEDSADGDRRPERGRFLLLVSGWCCCFAAANRPSPTCPPPGEQMFNAAHHQFQSHQLRQMTPPTDTATDKCSGPASLSPSISSPPPLPHDGAVRSGDSPPTAPVSGAGPLAAPRRRAVDASDLRQCALVQTRLKAWKSGYVFISSY